MNLNYFNGLKLLLQLEITELTHNKVSRYALNATRNSTLQHVIEHVPVGGRFNICVAVSNFYKTPF